jgi:hypothetical protein
MKKIIVLLKKHVMSLRWDSTSGPIDFLHANRNVTDIDLLNIGAKYKNVYVWKPQTSGLRVIGVQSYCCDIQLKSNKHPLPYIARFDYSQHHDRIISFR